MNDTAQERRRSNRQAVVLDAQYDSRTMVLRGRVTNLSKTGLFVESEFLDDPGTNVALSLILATDKRPLAIAGRVARADAEPTKSGMGIQFTDLSDKSRERLARYIEDAHSERPSSVASAI